MVRIEPPLGELETMAAITPGVGGTLKSATAEGAAIEALMYLQENEANGATTNPQNRNFVQGQWNIDTKVFSGSYNFPAEQTPNADGDLVIVATDYLTGVVFDPGAGGTFKKTHAVGATLEILMYMQNKERVAASNPENRNGVQGQFNSDNGTYSGSFSFPFTVSFDANGRSVFAAKEYLL